MLVSELAVRAIEFARRAGADNPGKLALGINDRALQYVFSGTSALAAQTSMSPVSLIFHRDHPDFHGAVNSPESTAL